MGYLLIFVLILLYTAQSFLSKKYTEHYKGASDTSSSVFTVASGFFVALVSLLLCLDGFHASALTWVLGLINALALVAYNNFLLRSSQKGPYSVLMVFNVSGGIIIPSVLAAFLLGQKLSILKIVCILAVILSNYLVTKKADETARPNKSFLPLCFGLAIANGAYCTLLSLQGAWTGDGEKAEMVIITFFVAALLSSLLLLKDTKKKFISSFKQTKKSLFYLILASIVIASAVHMLTFILGLIDTAVLYTFDNSGVLVFSVLCSCIFFKEKLSKANLIGLIVLIFAMLIMSPIGEALLSKLPLLDPILNPFIGRG